MNTHITTLLLATMACLSLSSHSMLNDANINTNGLHKPLVTNHWVYEGVTIRVAHPSKINVYWKDKMAAPIQSFSYLFYLHKNLAFATNAGMFGQSLDKKPLGLYIEYGKKLSPVKKSYSQTANFGMQPQAVFLVTKDNIAKVVSVDDYIKLDEKDIRCATQSAPMLVIDGKINSKLTKSSSVTRRNGVGILKSGEVVFIYSSQAVTFQQFAQLFVDNGCTDAQYLDGTISNLLERREVIFDSCACYGPFIGVTF